MELGLPVEAAINVFLAKAIQAQGFPFSVALGGDTMDAVSSVKGLSNSEITEDIQHLVERVLPLHEIENLTMLAYCKSTFGISFPVLRLVKSPRPEDVRITVKDAKGRNRYSTSKIAQRGERSYVICTQWTDRHRAAFSQWRQIFRDN